MNVCFCKFSIIIHSGATDLLFTVWHISLIQTVASLSRLIRVRVERKWVSTFFFAVRVCVCADVEEMSGVSHEISFGLAVKPPVSPIILIIISVSGWSVLLLSEPPPPLQPPLLALTRLFSKGNSLGAPICRHLVWNKMKVEVSDRFTLTEWLQTQLSSLGFAVRTAGLF